MSSKELNRREILGCALGRRLTQARAVERLDGPYRIDEESSGFL
jgi:hypothetical protein